MLYIDQHVCEDDPDNKYTTTWHVGEGMPLIRTRVRVVTFQADSDELLVILDALRQHSRRS